MVHRRPWAIFSLPYASTSVNWRQKVSDKQPPIPGLEPFYSLLSPPDRITFVEKRVAALELEIAILKIQMERAYA